MRNQKIDGTGENEDNRDPSPFSLFAPVKHPATNSADIDLNIESSLCIPLLYADSQPSTLNSLND
jgi:hypothetical protein